MAYGREMFQKQNSSILFSTVVENIGSGSAMTTFVQDYLTLNMVILNDTTSSNGPTGPQIDKHCIKHTIDNRQPTF